MSHYIWIRHGFSKTYQSIVDRLGQKELSIIVSWLGKLAWQWRNLASSVTNSNDITNALHCVCIKKRSSVHSMSWLVRSLDSCIIFLCKISRKVRKFSGNMLCVWHVHPGTTYSLYPDCLIYIIYLYKIALDSCWIETWFKICWKGLKVTNN